MNKIYVKGYKDGKDDCDKKWRDDVLRLKSSILDFEYWGSGTSYGSTIREVREEIALQLQYLIEEYVFFTGEKKKKRR